MEINGYSSSSYLKEIEYKGKFEAEVTDNKDPLNEGRLLVKAVNIMDEVEFSARPCVPFAGSKAGFYMIPEVGSRVWIEFIGNMVEPIWTGCLWKESDGKELPTSDQKTKTHEKVIQSTSGMKLVFDDEKGQVTVSGKDDENQVVIEESEGKIIIKSRSKVEIQANNVSVGTGASFSAVQGEKLLMYLTGLAAAARYTAPTSSQILSNSVKIK